MCFILLQRNDCIGDCLPMCTGVAFVRICMYVCVYLPSSTPLVVPHKACFAVMGLF